MKPLDTIDQKILNILQEDSTISVKDIAEQVGLSFTPTYERIKNMKNNGIIKKYVAILDAEKVGYEIIAYCNITLKELTHELLKDFEERMRNEPCVLEVVTLTGTYDFMIKVVAKSIKEYNKFVTDAVSNIPNLAQCHSNIVLSVIKNETKLSV